MKQLPRFVVVYRNFLQLRTLPKYTRRVTRRRIVGARHVPQKLFFGAPMFAHRCTRSIWPVVDRETVISHIPSGMLMARGEDLFWAKEMLLLRASKNPIAVMRACAVKVFAPKKRPASYRWRTIRDGYRAWGQS